MVALVFIYSLFGYCWYFSSTLLCSSWLCASHFKNNPERGAVIVTITMTTNILTLSKNARIISNHILRCFTFNAELQELH